MSLKTMIDENSFKGTRVDFLEENCQPRLSQGRSFFSAAAETRKANAYM
jgi:hypothetical protein